MEKRHWRCFVCNDIHHGVAPPGLCPTCKVPNAYVEVSAAEARRIVGGGADTSLAPDEFRTALERFAAGNEFRLNPDRERVDLLLRGVFENERRYGLKFCPCRVRTKDWEEDLRIVCPCNFTVHETYQGAPGGACWCGLFVRRT
ncbi:MAG TPA: ferredoxin-thioredoxin reductase catalytic domain-containing protein [Candidatus Aminicenantes bacterium]|nr:ferredoxin-thioredoxin reductase catalytic domain-containing protein [Candidatus Aminicenantes bacterium]